MAVVTMRELYSHFTNDLVPLQNPGGFTFLKHAIDEPLLIFIMCTVHTDMQCVLCILIYNVYCAY
jgi:hypothetical protein